MIIDIHNHTFPDKLAEHALKSLQSKSHTIAFSDATVSGLADRERKAGIDLAVVLPVATRADQVRGINDRAAEQNLQLDLEGLRAGEAAVKASKAGAGTASGTSISTGRAAEAGESTGAGSGTSISTGKAQILSFGCIHPEVDGASDELKRLKALGFLGIKIHPVYQETDIDSEPFIRILETAADLGLIVVTHSGKDIGYPGADQCTPRKIRNAVKSADPEGRTLRFVAAHMGGWRMWEQVPDQLADTGVYLDTAFSTGRFYPLDDGYYDGKDTSLMDPDDFMELYRAFGADRILFGTDSPWSSAEESISFIRGLPVSEEDKAMILGGSAARLLGITVNEN